MLRNTFERYCIKRALLNDTLYEKWFELQLRVAQWQRERENTNISLAPREKGGDTVYPFHPFPPLRGKNILVESQVRPPEVECKAIPSGLLNAFRFPGKSAFPGFSYRTKRWPRSDKRERRF